MNFPYHPVDCACQGCYQTKQAVADLDRFRVDQAAKIDQLLAQNKRLSDMEAKYHDDIQCRDTMLDTATATIARQVGELAEAWEEARQWGEEYGISADHLAALICGIWDKATREREALRDGLEKLAEALPIELALELRDKLFGASMEECHNLHAYGKALAAAQALLSGSAPGEPSAELLDFTPSEAAIQKSSRHYKPGTVTATPVEDGHSFHHTDSPTGTADDAIQSATVEAVMRCSECGRLQDDPLVKPHFCPGNESYHCWTKDWKAPAQRADHPIHTRTERPIQVGDLVRHKTQGWTAKVYAVSRGLTKDYVVLYDGYGSVEPSQLERVDLEKGPNL